MQMPLLSCLPAFQNTTTSRSPDSQRRDFMSHVRGFFNSPDMPRTLAISGVTLGTTALAIGIIVAISNPVIGLPIAGIALVPLISGAAFLTIKGYSSRNTSSPFECCTLENPFSRLGSLFTSGTHQTETGAETEPQTHSVHQATNKNSNLGSDNFAYISDLANEESQQPKLEISVISGTEKQNSSNQEQNGKLNNTLETAL